MVVVCSSGEIFRGFGVGVDLAGIFVLIGHVVVVVVMVEGIDLGCDACLFEGGAYDFDEVALLLPSHEHRG